MIGGDSDDLSAPMIDSSDTMILTRIRKTLLAETKSTFVLTDGLLHSRDMLGFDDDDWYHRFTQQVVNLDSLASFRAKNTLEEKRAADVFENARSSILQLVDAKLV